MKYKHRIAAMLLVFLVVGGVVSGVFGEPVSPRLAQTVVDKFSELIEKKSSYYRLYLGTPKEVAAGGMQVLREETTGTPLAYVFDIFPVGYLVVSTDTEITPVVAYSYESDFSWEDVEENILLRMLELDMGNRLRAVSKGQMDPQVVERNQILWDEYLGKRPAKRTSSSPTVYGPWTTTQWHQSSPYNDDCPIDPTTGDRSVVGCVVTAMSQILNYWQYPTLVTFTASDDYTTDTRGINIDASTANFSGLNYNGGDPSNADKAALCFAAGVSVRMDYTSTGSAAYTSDVALALSGSGSPWSGPPQRWGYVSAEVRTCNPDYSYLGHLYYVSESSFYDQLSSDMQLGRPGILSIYEEGISGGHAIVVDGWQDGGRVYHLNYGWGSSCWGWYTLPSGMPYGYDTIELAILNIVPTPTTRSLTLNTSGTGNGSIARVPDQLSFTHGTHVLLTATPDSGSTFDHWEGDLTGSTNPTRIIMDENKSVTACFVPSGEPVVTFTLDVTFSGAGSGSVTVDSTAHASADGAFQLTYSHGTWVELTASASASSTFAGWSGDADGTGTVMVEMTSNRAVEATFALKTYTITASAGANGSISPTGEVSVNYGADQTFTITPDTGYEIADVTVDESSALDDVTITDGVGTYQFTNVTEGHTIHATFEVTVAAPPATWGVFRNGMWYLDKNGDGDAADTGEAFYFGNATDTPLVGDWNGDGTDTWGVFRNGTWYLDINGNGDAADTGEAFRFGNATDTPLVGDWNGDGTDTWGVFRNGAWFLDKNGDHDAADTGEAFYFGNATDTPLVGDWNGDGTDTCGVFRAGAWFLDKNGDGDAADTGEAFYFGNATDTPLVGDWNGDGTDTWGVFRAGAWFLDINGDRDAADPGEAFYFGLSTDTPLVGNWGSGSAAPLSAPAESTSWYAMCFPNPASTGDAVTFRMMGAGVHAVKVSVYDLGGGLVYQSNFETGRSLTWDLYSEGAPVANGIYLYSLIAKANGELIETEIGKLLILR